MKNKGLDLEVDLEASWRSIWSRFGCLLQVSWESFSGLSAVSWRSLGHPLEVAWKSSWQHILRYGADDAGTFRSLWNPGG